METKEQAVERVANEIISGGNALAGILAGPVRPVQCVLVTHPQTLASALRVTMNLTTFEQEGVTPDPVGTANFAIAVPMASCNGDPEVAKLAALRVLRDTFNRMFELPEFVEGVKVVDALQAAERARHRADKLREELADPAVPTADKLAAAIRGAGEALGLDIGDVQVIGIDMSQHGESPSDDTTKQ